MAIRLTSVLIGRDTEYFDLFESAATNVVHAADLLVALLRGYPDTASVATDISGCEQQGDQVTREIIERLNRTFVTPIDREDILELASAMDDIVDLIEEVADYLGLYKIEAPMERAQQQAEILLASTRVIARAMPALRDFKPMGGFREEVNRFENDGDRVTREAIAGLFEGGIDPMVVIRWKDIYERLEAAIDATEHVADILSGIVIKNA